MPLKPGLTQATFFRHAILRDAMPDAVDAMQTDTVLHEVWLLDTGRFLVLRRSQPEFLNGRGWVLSMRKHRVLRMFLPESEIAKLPDIYTHHKIGNRGFEIRDLVVRARQRGVIDNTPSIDDLHEGVTLDGPRVEQIKLLQRRLRDALNTLRSIGQHTDLFPAENTSIIRTTPWEPSAAYWWTRDNWSKILDRLKSAPKGKQRP